MDNNFDENNNIPSSGNADGNVPEASETLEGRSPAENSENSKQPADTENSVTPSDPQSENYDQPFEQNNAPTDGGSVNYDRFAPNNVPPQNGQFPGYVPPVYTAPPAKKRKLSGGCLWIIIITIITLFGLILILAAKISSDANSGAPQETVNENPKYDNLITRPASNTEIVIPTSPKPVLEEKYYADESTGLLTTIGVAEKVLPSQVKIEIFDDMPYLPISSGSGIVISSDGYILTNAHVIDGASKIAVTFYDDTSEEAVFVGMDRKTDLAVIKVDRDDLVSAEIGTSSSLVIGEEVALAGAGGGFANTVTYGHITGLARTIDTDYISSSSVQCIQTDAALNPGNSGGALVNMYGQVVGVAVALMNHETYENIGFSIAIDDAVPIAEDLIANGYVSTRSRIGISFVSIGDAAADGYGIMSGLCVMEVDPQCEVYYEDIRPYDIITHIEGTRVFGSEEIVEALQDSVPGDVVTLTIFRKEITGETDIFDISVELAPDTASEAGYSSSISEEDRFSRDIIK